MRSIPPLSLYNAAWMALPAIHVQNGTGRLATGRGQWGGVSIRSSRSGKQAKYFLVEVFNDLFLFLFFDNISLSQLL